MPRLVSLARKVSEARDTPLFAGLSCEGKETEERQNITENATIGDFLGKNCVSGNADRISDLRPSSGQGGVF